MIRSMTGFGQGAAETAALRATVELRSVNGRFADLRVRVPAEFAGWEREARKRVLDRVRRGRIEMTVAVEDLAPAAAGGTLNRPLAEAVLAAAGVLRAEFGVVGDLDVARMLGVPGMVQASSGARACGDDERAALDAALESALEAFDADRRREGSSLAGDLLRRAEAMRSLVERMRASAADMPARVRERIAARIEAVAGDVEIDASRLAQEVALLADRSDVTEELVRLASHLEQLAELLASAGPEPQGKRLDFLAQELHREINTVGSKSVDLDLTRAALEFKAETEKVREQVQNIE